MLHIAVYQHDSNGIPLPEPPHRCAAATACPHIAGSCPVHDLPYPDSQHSADKFTDLAARAFRDHDPELALEYLVRAATFRDRPYNRIRKGYRLIDRALHHTNVLRDFCTCEDRTYDRGLPCIHLIRAGCPYVVVTTGE